MDQTLGRMGFIKDGAPRGAEVLAPLHHSYVLIKLIVGLRSSRSHLRVSVLIGITSLARRSMAPLVFAGSASLKKPNAKDKYRAEFVTAPFRIVCLTLER